MHYLAPPPARTHSTSPISTSFAHEMIARYLEAAQSNAALHPDAQLTEQGVVPAQGGGRLGLTLHNLQRIEAGLRGERMQAEISIGSTGVNNEESQLDEAGEEWVDKDVFEREQDVDEVLVRDGPNEREDEGGEVLDVDVDDEDGLPNGATAQDSGKNKRKKGKDEKIDKDARKKAKKERRKLEKAESEARRKRATSD